jgi:CheY-like chemotaxis protein
MGQSIAGQRPGRDARWNDWGAQWWAWRGSELIVRLPQAKPEPISKSQAEEADRQKTSPMPKYRILVVDDNRLSAQSTAMALGLMGHDLVTACDGIEGIELARTFRPDVILMDIGLPEMNGHETARRIRDQPGGKNILLIAVTGYGQEEDRRRSLDAGFDYHLVKPLNFAELKNKLSELRAVPEKPRRFLTRAKTRWELILASDLGRNSAPTALAIKKLLA